MFYTKNKIIPYPNKTIIEDVLSREGMPGPESYTPFRGCASILRRQFENMDTNGHISVADIIEHEGEFKMNKARANDDGVDRDVAAGEIRDYYTRLEDIDQDYIDKYINSIIIGYKKHNRGLNDQRYLMQTLEKVYDEDEDDFVSLTDLLLTEQDFTAEDIIEAESRLPYVLKQLYDGSIQMGGSLLSFIIAAEKCLHDPSGGAQLRPRHIVNQGVWRMERDGSMVNQFKIEDNTAERFRNLYAWICGVGEGGKNNIYYKAYRELLEICAILGINIRDEDPTQYDGKYIDSIVCTYIASNEEYLETYGFVDQKILNMLSPDKLFSVAKSMSNSESVSDVKLTTEVLIECIVNNVDRLVFMSPKDWVDNFDKVKRFLSYKTGKVGTQLANYIRTLEVDKGVLRNTNGEYLLLDVSTLFYGRKAFLAAAGKLVLFDENIERICYIDTDRALSILKGETAGDIDAWTTICL